MRGDDVRRETAATGSSRRRFLQATAGAATAAATAATAPAVAAQEQAEPDYGGWFDGVPNYNETVDRTGQSEVTVQVGTDTSKGPYGFSPPAMKISPGTTVTFEYVSAGHNVLVEEQPEGAEWAGDEAINGSGYSFTHTFEAEGMYKYYCNPHIGLGMKGAIVVTGDLPEPDYGGWFSDVPNYESTVDQRDTEEVVVEVGTETENGPYGFSPAAVRISPGTTVRFRYVSAGHNVLPESIPGDSDWQGDEAINNSGYEFTHTFETEGVYTYFCEPHRSLGMKGAIVVGNVGGGHGGSSFVFKPSQSIYLVGGAVAVAFLSPAIFGLYLLRNRQQPRPDVSYEGPQRAEAAGAALPAETPEAPVAEPAQSIEHDEYDPWGTASLVVLYFLILVLMWMFTYFVEFLGNGPTITG
jgi:halocyanin-like protein